LGWRSDRGFSPETLRSNTFDAQRYSVVRIVSRWRVGFLWGFASAAQRHIAAIQPHATESRSCAQPARTPAGTSRSTSPPSPSTETPNHQHRVWRGSGVPKCASQRSVPSSPRGRASCRSASTSLGHHDGDASRRRPRAAHRHERWAGRGRCPQGREMAMTEDTKTELVRVAA
jgi:DNA-binding protein H-NS